VKALVVFYSRTGNTREVAEAIADELKCDVEEIVDLKDRSGVMGFLLAGRDVTLGRLADIRPSAKDPSDYDVVIAGTPIWSFTVSSPVRTYLLQNKGKFKKLAFYCMSDGSGGGRAFKEMERVCGVKLAATLEMTSREISSGVHKEKIKQFLKVFT